MENLNALLIIIVVSLAVGAALYEAFLQLTGRLVTKPPKVNWRKNWAGALETLGPVKIHPLDSWVRDGSKPPPDNHGRDSEEVIVRHGTFYGVGRYDHLDKAWFCSFLTRAVENKFLSSGQSRKEVDAWQKFPEYEKI